ncbi:MAG: PA0069 family radical SAM protein [Burkholderiaceae bacterium]|jgi:DNA repair photolyase
MKSSDAKRYIEIVPMRGRGAVSNRESRFLADGREIDLDYLDALRDDLPDAAIPTETTLVEAKSIISRNDSPDIGFDRSINPFLGCEHGCIYCYARPTHAYLGLSPGLDFETKLTAKTNAAALLRKELSARNYQPQLIALGANTDPYQPVEKELQVTRAVLQVLDEFNHPVAITTKSALVVRDIDILGPMAARGLARVAMSIGTIDAAIARAMEPRANSPARRLQAIEKLTRAGVPTSVIVAPIVPALTDAHLERVIELAANAGADSAHYVLLRLPLEVRDLFVEWLEAHYPLRAKHVMSLVNQMRGGKDYDAAFSTRMKGTGLFAELIAKRFRLACARHGLNLARKPLTTALFAVPDASGQASLF